MTVTLIFDNVLSRVRLAANTLGLAAAATVERSTDLIKWATVRGGVSAPTLPGGLNLAGVAGEYASTPDNAALDITGDIDLRADATLSDWTPLTPGALLAKWNESTNNRSYLFFLNTTGTLGFTWSADGTTVVGGGVGSTVAVPATSGRLAVRVTLDVDNGAAGRTSTFYTAPTMAGPWTQLGAPVTTAGTTSIFSGTAIAEVGTHTAGTLAPLAGVVHAAEVRSGIGGTTVANPVFRARPDGTASFGDGAGRTWTINGNAEIISTALLASVDDYEFVSGVVNNYRATALPAGLYLAGSVGYYASTPDNAALDITGDIDLRADLTLSDWTPAAASVLVAKWTESGNQRAYLFFLDTNGTLSLVWSTNGTATLSFSSSVAVPATSGRLAVRVTLDVDNGAAGRTATFYTAPTIAGPWTQLGTTQTTAGTTSIFASTAILELGTHGVGTTAPLAGIVHAAEVRNGINGTAAANPDFAAQANGTTGFADTAGRTWTVNGTGAQILTSQSATTTPVLDGIWLKSVMRPFLNRKVIVVDWSPEERPSRNGGFPAVGRTLEIAVTDVAGGLAFDLDLHVSNQQDAQTLDYIRASGDILFLHVPLNCPVPGGHVCLDTTSARRVRPRGASRVFSLPLRQCAAPGPDVVGATSTWQTVLNSYASWPAVLAANPTWADLRARIAPPSEVIVP